MRRNKRPLPLLIVAIIALISLIALIIFVPPTTNLPLGIITVPIFPLFLVLTFMVSFSFPTYLLRSPKHGILISLFILFFLILRLVGLTHPLFTVLLVALFLTSELLFTKNKV